MITNVKIAIQTRIHIFVGDLRHISALYATQILMVQHLWLNIILNDSNCLIGKEF
jgi:hypothetical protein